MTANAKPSINENISGDNYPMPSKYKVYIFNDEVTPRNFVKELLTVIFRQDDADSEYCIEEIEREGLAPAGKYSFEVAEQKVAECNKIIKSSNLDLVVTFDSE